MAVNYIKGYSPQRARFLNKQQIRNAGKSTPIYYPPNFSNHINNVKKKLVHPLVTSNICKQLGIEPTDIRSYTIDPKLRTKMKYVWGNVVIHPSYAKKIRGDGFCLVLGGGTDRIFAHLGVLEMMEKAGLKPDFIVGTSAGAIIGAMYAYYGSIQKVKELIYAAIAKHSYQDIADLNLDKLRDGEPFSGVFKWDNLLNIIEKDFGLKDVKFSQLKIPLFISGVEANDGLLYWFADTKKAYNELAEDPRKMKKSRFKVSRMRFYEGKITIAQAARISASLPGGAVPYRTKYKRKIFDWYDGGVRMNNPVAMALKLFGVKDVLLNALGYCGAVKGKKGKYGDKSAPENFMHAWDISGWRQLDDLKDNDYKDEDVSVRGINVGSFNIQTPQAYMLAQRLIISSKETMKKVIRIVCNGEFNREMFFSEWSNRLVNKLERAGITFEEYSRGGRGVYFVIDSKAAIMTKKKNARYWRRKEIQEGGKKPTRPPQKTLLMWFFNEMRKACGLPFTLWTAFYGVTAKLWFFRNKVQHKYEHKIKHELKEGIRPVCVTKDNQKA